MEMFQGCQELYFKCQIANLLRVKVKEDLYMKSIYGKLYSRTNKTR